MTEEAAQQQVHQEQEAAPVQSNGAPEESAPAQQDAPMQAPEQPAPAEVEPEAQAAPEEPAQAEVQNEAAAEQAPQVEQKSAEPAPTTNGATTRQRSGKVTPARPQPPKLAPKPISKSKKSKKKGKQAAKTVMTFYGYWRSGCSWRVRLVLALKGFNFGKEVDYVPIHLVKDGGEQKTDSYTKINPAQMVPSLIVKDKSVTKKPVTLSESMAICEYLEETYPAKRKLLPKDPFKRFQVRRLCEMLNAGTQPLQNLAVLNEVQGRFGVEARKPWAQWVCIRGLTAFEAQVEQTKGKYCLGNIITLADTFLPPMVYSAERHEVDMSQFPNVMSIMENLQVLPEFANAHPSQQPDAQV